MQAPSDAFLAPLAPWFERVRRELPWRARDLDAPHPDPWAVLVSEVMLQQTQVTAVVPFFLRWMARFPAPACAAEADPDEVHKLWEGLGYYRRARNLQACAAALATSGWPTDLPGLLALPGLGPYTAAAVAAIAFQRPEAALDGNAFRLLARLLALPEDPRGKAGALRVWLRPALASHGPSRMTQAVMELGATLCGPGTPRCGNCPLSDRCAARQRGIQATLPVTPPRRPPRELDLLLAAVGAEGHWLLHRPATRGLLAGLWSWPRLEAPGPSAPADGSAPQQQEIGTWEGWTQAYTHRRERVQPLLLRLSRRFQAAEGLAWIPEEALEGLPMGRRDQRLRDLLGQPPREGGAPEGLAALLAAVRASGS